MLLVVVVVAVFRRFDVFVRVGVLLQLLLQHRACVHACVHALTYVTALCRFGLCVGQFQRFTNQPFRFVVACVPSNP